MESFIESFSLWKLLIGLAVGALSGLLVIPPAARGIISYKSRKRGTEPRTDILKSNKLKVIIVLVDLVLTALAAILLEIPTGIFATLMIQLAIVCVIVDSYIRLIANEAILLMLVLGIGYRIFDGGASSLLGSLGALGIVIALFGGCAFYMLKKKGNPGVGAGDLKYAMVLAIAVGWNGVFYFLGGMALALLAYILIGMKTRNINMLTYFPMCLQLSVGMVVAMFLLAFKQLGI